LNRVYDTIPHGDYASRRSLANDPLLTIHEKVGQNYFEQNDLNPIAPEKSFCLQIILPINPRREFRPTRIYELKAAMERSGIIICEENNDQWPWFKRAKL
jgi:hypothetical protein